MYKYVCISLKSLHNVSHLERKSYLNSFYGSYMDKKYGMVEKFVKAIGFNPILDDYVKNYPVVESAKIESPESYKSPINLLYDSLHIDLDKKGILKFVVPMGKEVHSNPEFSYSHKKLCEKFFKFLQKVYPDLDITYSLLESFRPTLRTFALDFFYQNMSTDIHYTVEFSSHRMLRNEEIDYICKVLKEWIPYSFHINQYYCEVCKGYHPKSPYHIEIEYD